MKWNGPDDVRPLSQRGRQQAERLGTLLAARGIRPDVIVTSPLVRAAQTAEIVAAALGMTALVDQRLAEPLSLSAVERIIRDAGGREPMLVGHDPDFSALVTDLCGGVDLAMRKGTLATLDVDLPLASGDGHLRWLLPPELLADAR